jgi:hypothetical protein
MKECGITYNDCRIPLFGLGMVVKFRAPDSGLASLRDSVSFLSESTQRGLCFAKTYVGSDLLQSDKGDRLRKM